MSNTNSLLELLANPDTAKTAPTSGDARTPLAGLEVLIRMIVQEELHRQPRPSLVDGDNTGGEGDDASDRPGKERNAARPNADEADAHVMSAEAVAAFLGVDRNTVYDYAGRGTIPCRRLGKRLLFHKPALVAWLDPCKAASTRKG